MPAPQLAPGPHEPEHRGGSQAPWGVPLQPPSARQQIPDPQSMFAPQVAPFAQTPAHEGGMHCPAETMKNSGASQPP